jgi:hypothetical protein
VSNGFPLRLSMNDTLVRMKTTAQRSVPTAPREQLITECEVALAALVSNEKEAVERFISQTLKLPTTWLTVVGQALLDKDRRGNYRWQEAKNPVGLIRTIAKRNAGKTHPELLGFPNQSSTSSPSLLPLSQVSQGDVSLMMGFDRDSGGSVSGQGLMDQVSFDSVDFEEDTITLDIDAGLRTEADMESPFDYDWDSIGKRMGLSADETAILKAKAAGTARSAIATTLGWDEARVQRVWRALNRILENPATAALAQKALLH